MIDSRGPATAATSGTQCSQSCWHAPPITNRSPWPSCHDRDGPPPSRPHLERARRAGADDGHDRVLVVVALAVGVPGHRVAAVAVQVEADRVERALRSDGVSAARASASTGSGSGRRRRGAPPRGEPRLGQHAVVHDDLALAATAARRPARRTPGRRRATSAGTWSTHDVVVEPRARDGRRTSASTGGSSKANRHCCQMRSASASGCIDPSSRIERMFASRRRTVPPWRSRSTTRSTPGWPTTAGFANAAGRATSTSSSRD